MIRIPIKQREDWKQQAETLGFPFHSIGGATYWDESACYRFTLAEIEQAIEDPTAELEQMCFEVVEKAVHDSEALSKLAIPQAFWDPIRNSWLAKEKNLYGRMDFSYDGKGPAKLLEYNADTPTSLYESAVFQWIWLEQAMERGLIPPDCDQFNSIQESLIDAFQAMGIAGTLHLASCRDSIEDESTVLYLEECAVQAGLDTRFIHIEDIGIDAKGRFSDLDDNTITTLFKLYPWEWLMREDFAPYLPKSQTAFIEPMWKAILSNKGVTALLWDMFPNHPNLLPTFFEGDKRISDFAETGYVRKPLFSREGANIEMVTSGGHHESLEGPYGEEGYVLQALAPLPQFEGNHTVIGSWLVASQPCGIGLREDNGPITKDTSRFLPHVIRD